MSKLAAACILVFTNAIFGQVYAATCEGISPPSNKWVRNMASRSKFIFHGTIVAVKSSKRSTQQIQINIDKQIKGRFNGAVFSEGWGPGYTLKVGETRIFFVGHDKHLLSCSDYKSYFTDYGVLSEINNIMDST